MTGRRLEELFPIIPMGKATGDSYFGNLYRTVARESGTWTAGEIREMSSRFRLLGDYSTLASIIPELLNRYANNRLLGSEDCLYGSLIWLRPRLSLEQYQAVTKVVLQHWKDACEAHSPPETLTVTVDEVSFLLLWLSDVSPVEPFLRSLATAFVQTDRSLISVLGADAAIWTSWVEGLRAQPIDTLLTACTYGAVEVLDQEMVSRASAVLRRTRLLPSERI